MDSRATPAGGAAGAGGSMALVALAILILLTALAASIAMPAGAPPQPEPRPPPDPPRASAPRASAPTPPPADVEDAQVRHCLQGVAARVPGAPLAGSLQQARSLHTTHEHRVRADNETIVRALALRPVLQGPLAARDLMDRVDERTEVCVFERIGELNRTDVLSLLALAGHDPSRPVPADARIVARFHLRSVADVSLDADVVRAVLALHDKGDDIPLDDVLDYHRETRLVSQYAAVVSHEPDEVLLELALRGPQPAGDGDAEPHGLEENVPAEPKPAAEAPSTPEHPANE